MPAMTTGVDDETTIGSTTSTGTTSIASSSSTSSPLPSDDGPAPDVPDQVVFAEIASIFSTHCVTGCHSPGGEHPELDLSTSPRNNLVLVASSESALFLVSAGDHEASYLWHKLSGTQGMVGGNGARMPAGARPLDQEDIDRIAAWIDAGAPP
jgi:mono/diheme cytochrome c family protein